MASFAKWKPLYYTRYISKCCWTKSLPNSWQPTLIRDCTNAMSFIQYCFISCSLWACNALYSLCSMLSGWHTDHSKKSLKPSTFGIWKRCWNNCKRMEWVCTGASADFSSHQWSTYRSPHWCWGSVHIRHKSQSHCQNPSTYRNVSELCSFLGLVKYYGKVVPNPAPLLHPLHQLLWANSHWMWTKECQHAFHDTKAKFVVTQICQLLWQERQISAVIIYVMPNSTEQPITYTSCTLSSTEKYAQVKYFWHQKVTPVPL